MTSSDRSAVTRPFWAAALALPTINAAVGIDGGAIFQIFATENLGIGSRALGIAFGMGILSVPVQLWAARLPLWQARRNLQLHLFLTALEVAILAGLVAALGPGDPLVIAALIITVLGEINVSVLYATTWQPLRSYALTTIERQRLGSRGAALSGAFKAVAAVVFGAGGTGVRVALLAAGALGALALAASLRKIPVPDRPPPSDPAEPAPARVRVPDGMRPLYIAVGLTAAGAWPLFLVYASKVLWPTVNLGILAAVQLGGSLLAAASWRATAGEVAGRARWAALVSAAATVLVAAVPAPVVDPVEKAAVLVAAVAASAATTIVFFTIMELAHRVIDERTSVRSMTIYDVVASTSMQAGLLVSGFLVALSADHDWRVDPYKAYLVFTALAVFAVFSRIAPRRPVLE